MMKVIIGLLTAVLLSVYTFCSTCWYAASTFFQTLIPVLTAVFLGYIAFVYVLSRLY